ncbi:DUF2274 domain-containing protein [Paracoccus pantotrophus]|uniref:DUF2274 domain-containing protein n=1 Tax=Paracoccus pantotrophus TaxID=82367 RepID=UPI003F68A5EB
MGLCPNHSIQRNELIKEFFGSYEQASTLRCSPAAQPKIQWGVAAVYGESERGTARGAVSGSFAYGQILGREAGGPPIEPAKLIVPMLKRFITTNRGFAKAKRIG